MNEESAIELDATGLKAVQLLKYVREFIKLKTQRKLLIEDYEPSGMVLWINDLPHEHGCVCPAWTQVQLENKEDVWLEVSKQQIPSLPKLPEILQPWVDPEKLNHSSGQEPSLRQETLLPAAPDEELQADVVDDEEEEEECEPNFEAHRLKDHPELLSLWDKYLEKWRPWAKEHKRRSKLQSIYSRLFDTYQKSKRLGESFELLAGIGFLAWKNEQGKVVRRHIFVAQADIEFDSENGRISIKCPPLPDGAKPRIESDFLDGAEIPEQDEFESVTAQLTALENDIWHRSSIEPLLKSWGHAIHPDTQVSFDLKPAKGTPEKPTLNFAPAIILRKRTTRSIQEVYRSMIGQLESGTKVPNGIARLVDHLEDEDGTWEEAEGDPIP
ncbi:MAG: hypothetical protein JRF33_27705, partial [Deltaproteobacteria bacterium]|nr:hypothetical protein [Deltaproteobacteria bacterium]